ncbi:archaellin/type IV pilin N-terminal domain-containing protein [Thermogladius calderae]|uniref:archaellin/type IV pilin N-terminal domain-containing protein n=1 Tax=Thermogladius calderae TaxID=1200300 RepID=UPI00064FB0E2|nr:archaellin/type IV pilin N-terminal domain-containing protein [Thermogladius calderae]
MRAISPVIATVIIVAVTIAVAIAVALWMTGLVGGFTGTENLQIVNAYALARTGGAGWDVYLSVKNAGTTTATIDQIFVNGIPYTSITLTSPAGATISLASPTPLPITLSPGQDTSIQLYIPKGSGQALAFSPGQQVEIKLHTASGKTYPVQVVLP